MAEPSLALPPRIHKGLRAAAAYISLALMIASWLIEGEFSQSLVDGCDHDNSTESYPGKTDLCYQSHFFITCT